LENYNKRFKIWTIHIKRLSQFIFYRTY